MRAALLLVISLAAPALAQDQEIQRQLIQRQQQSDAFTLQLRQSQELLRISPARRGEIERRQTSERQALDNVSEKQLREVSADTPQEFRPQERHRAQEERRPFLSPVVEVPVTQVPPPPPLKPRLEGNVDVIEAPR